MNKISIIIPAYNTVDVINRTLESIEKQTYSNYEIIIVNDGSTDTTKQYLDNYKKDKNNVVIYHQENQGVSAARNKGIELANGEFVCFLDSDDTYEPTFLEKMIKKQNSTDAYVIYCGWNTITLNNRIKKETLNITQISALSFFLDNWFHISSMIMSRNFILKENIRFDITKRLGEDSLFTVELLLKSKAVYIPEHLYNYFHRVNSTTHSIRDENHYIRDLEPWDQIVNYITDNYKEDDRENIIRLAKKYKGLIELNYLIFFIKSFKYKELKKYIKNNGLSDLLSVKDILRKSEKRKLAFIVKNNYFSFFMASIYYQYIRR